MRKVRSLIKSIIGYFEMHFHKMRFGDRVFFSIGENCLADKLLARNRIKSFSSPYSSGRSNVEQILFFEKESFTDFLNTKYLTYENVNNQRVVKNTKFVITKNHYHPSCSNGFEFTHHDVINDLKIQQKIRNRCMRQLSLCNKAITMLYHHRLFEQTDEKLLVEHLKQLRDIYVNRGNKVRIIAFTQVIVSSKEERKVIVERLLDKNDGNVLFYKFYTLNIWGGNDPNIFWANCDDDLLKIMMKEIRSNF